MVFINAKPFRVSSNDDWECASVIVVVIVVINLGDIPCIIRNFHHSNAEGKSCI